MHSLAEEDETSLLCSGMSGMSAPPSLPPPPSLMSPDQTKRRFIINSLVQSENNYLDSLNRLIADYKVPLEESNPPILSGSLSLVNTIFSLVIILRRQGVHHVLPGSGDFTNPLTV